MSAWTSCARGSGVRLIGQSHLICCSSHRPAAVYVSLTLTLVSMFLLIQLKLTISFFLTFLQTSNNKMVQTSSCTVENAGWRRSNSRQYARWCVCGGGLCQCGGHGGAVGTRASRQPSKPFIFFFCPVFKQS